MRFVSFAKARSFVRQLGLKSSKEWRGYCKSGKKPKDIPTTPERSYRKEWINWGDWLGTGNMSSQNRKYRPFNEAKKYVQSLGFTNIEEWKQYCKSGNKPHDIPAKPFMVYKKEWQRWFDWLGSPPLKGRRYRSFEDARKFVHGLKLKSQSAWEEYYKSGNKPEDIPTNPAETYSFDWKSFGDWIGTDRIADQYREYRPFEDAREFVRKLGLKNVAEWKKYCKSEKKPVDIPAKPYRTYKIHWVTFGDWLGTGTVATKDRIYTNYENAQQFVHNLGLKSYKEWQRYCNSRKKPENIPNSPEDFYKPQWTGWPDWLGYEEKALTVKKVKELLSDLIKSGIIYQWDEAVLYSFLLRRGLLNLANRHSSFFKNLISASRTQEGKKLIEQYAYSSSEIPPDLSKLTNVVVDNSNEIETASISDLSRLEENNDPLEYENVGSVEQILQNTNILESVNVDEESIQFYVNYSIAKLWKCAFEKEDETISRTIREGKNANKYHDIVVETFLSDFQETKAIAIPLDYSFPFKPTLMQQFVAYKVKSLPYFGNFSGTGAGKTLSAILSSRVINSKMTVIVCPNDVVNQWATSIKEIFPNSKVTTGKDAFFIHYDSNSFKYLVLNYDKFSQEDSPNLILNLSKQKIDFVVLDEIHFSKIRNEEEISLRRCNLDGLMTLVRRKNPIVKVLGLSATPVVNNLREGKSLLELLTGKVYDDVATRPTIPNAVTLYEKLSTVSIRELPKYFADLDTHVIDVVAQRPAISVKRLKSNPLEIEKFLTDARIPEIIKLIDGQTIIYTEYVEDIIKKLSEAIENAGYSFGLYTGFDRSGLTKFLGKKVQVLIASRPLSVGVDGLQHICNRLIINTLPWTNAQYQQLLGRLVRKGQIRDIVHVYLIKASIGGYEYDELKWKRIQFKRTLADCAVDGVLPEKNLVTPQQAAMEAVKWLERLERGEISTVVRRDLNVELAPVEIRKRIVKYGDFARLNNRINNENSDTTHHRMIKDATEWEEYHRQYREARKRWTTGPYEEIIKRIKQLSPRLMIGDFGCGEAKILEEFGDNRVYSFDHVAINNKVKACDIKSTGLPDEAIDIAVFSLSLMGRNWPEYILEAKRCLAIGGYLLIADTTKSIKGRLSKIKEVVKKQGFEIYSDEQKGDFTFIEAREL